MTGNIQQAPFLSSSLPLDKIEELGFHRTVNSIPQRMKKVYLQIVDDIGCVVFSHLTAKKLKMHGRSGRHLLRNLVLVVFSIAIVPTAMIQASTEGCELLRLVLLFYAYLAILPVDQVQYNKVLWVTWVEIGRTLIRHQTTPVCRLLHDLTNKHEFSKIRLITLFTL